MFAKAQGNSVENAKDNSQYAHAQASSGKNQALRSKSIELKRCECGELLLNRDRIWFLIAKIESSCKLPRSCKLPLEEESQSTADAHD
jgi:hypothetical protein